MGGRDEVLSSGAVYAVIDGDRRRDCRDCGYKPRVEDTARSFPYSLEDSGERDIFSAAVIQHGGGVCRGQCEHTGEKRGLDVPGLRGGRLICAEHFEEAYCESLGWRALNEVEG